MRFKVQSSVDDCGIGAINYSDILDTYKDRGQCDFYKYGPAVVATGRYAQISFSSEDDNWDEIEKIGPSGADLIKFAQRNPAPEEWYNEAY